MASQGGVERAATELPRISTGLEAAGPTATLRWAREHFGSQLALACSFQDCVIVDLAVAVDPHLEVVFLDTGFHFPETLDFVEQVRRHYRLNLTVTKPGAAAEPWPCGTAQCCAQRKVAPLSQALAGKRAWLTGLKRCDAPTRAKTPVVGWDDAHQMVKVNPLAAWSDADIARYIEENELPEHPLVARGYRSIGCAPTTRPVGPDEDPRAGRWPGSDKTECGLHS